MQTKRCLITLMCSHSAVFRTSFHILKVLRQCLCPFSLTLGFCEILFNSVSPLQKVQVGGSITKATPTSPAAPNWIHHSRLFFFFFSLPLTVSLPLGVRKSVYAKDSRRLPSSGHFDKRIRATAKKLQIMSSYNKRIYNC